MYKIGTQIRYAEMTGKIISIHEPNALYTYRFYTVVWDKRPIGTHSEKFIDDCTVVNPLHVGKMWRNFK